MTPPPGYNPKGKNLVCRLQKSLYGLKQASRQWFEKFSTTLKEAGFIQSAVDYSLFTSSHGSCFTAVLVYVDDVIITGNDNATISHLKSFLNSKFRIKDLGLLKYFLGIEVARSATGLFLSQRKYLLDILKDTGFLDSKPAPFPMEQHLRLVANDEAPLINPESYRRLVGRLIYLTITWPDLTYSVHMLSQFMHKPGKSHLDAAHRVLRYLKGTPNHGFLLPSTCNLQLSAYSNSDWASCPTSRRSTTGYITFLGASPISWCTKKQSTVARSSAEAEYRSMATTSCELTWLKYLLTDLGVTHPKPMELHCDNQAALHIAANPVFHERTKHIELDCHLIREKIQSGLISTAYVPSRCQLADIFTKPLGREQFLFLLSKLGVSDLHSPA